MPNNGAYPTANLPLTGNETLLASQQQGGVPVTVNIPVFNLPPKYTVANLPTNVTQGCWAYVLDGRNPGESAGAGTGCLATVNSAGVWCAVWSGTAVTN
jgi:hypothetical protein